MKLAILTLLLATTAVTTQARPIHRPVINRPVIERAPEVCSFNLERKYTSRDGREGDVVRTFTEFGPRSCMMAEDACEVERMSRFRSWEFQCHKEFRSGPQFGERCEYRIETRFGFEPEIYSSVGFGACGTALDQCERDLKVKRARREVGPYANCVQTSASRPRPPRVVTATCRVILRAGRVGRDTGVDFLATASAGSYREAQDRACSEALRKCEGQARGRNSFCEVAN